MPDDEHTDMSANNPPASSDRRPGDKDAPRGDNDASRGDNDAPGGDGAKPVLEADHFSFSIEGKLILDDVSCRIYAGDFVSVIGPNGAGKSTFLKCLLRLQEKGRSEGRIALDGRDINTYGQKQLARVVSYVPQAGGWIPPFSVRELARLSRFPHVSAVAGLSRDDELAVDKALELAGLGKLAGRSLKTLSGGERQKAYLAAALAQEGRIMLLDEPAAALDPKHAFELAVLLEKLNKEDNLTVIMVTHDLNHPLRTGGLALVLSGGRETYFGPSVELQREGILEAAFDHKFLYLDHPSGPGRLVVA
ncbi:MAG: ABC transporter ATP-binding protein [Deltaproteobacteria bacterium]|jgi:iron complex transport system ATP-binding protein|nr:ABC transporter ATP-binding protein [Deltaproteobacteria bacterium]